MGRHDSSSLFLLVITLAKLALVWRAPASKIRWRRSVLGAQFDRILPRHERIFPLGGASNAGLLPPQRSAEISHARLGIESQ
jgi:hypothetical protein